MYQYEYHPQGLAFVYFAFLFFVILKIRPDNRMPNNRMPYVICLIVLIGALTISHHFSSLLLGLMAIFYVAVISFVEYVPYVKDKFSGVIRVVRSDYRMWLCIAVAMLAYHFIIYTVFMQSTLNFFESMAPTKMLINAGPNVPLYATLTSSSKWVLFLIAAVSLFYVIKTKNAYEFTAGVLFALLAGLLLVGTFGGFLPTTRLLGFYVFFAAIFGALTIFRFKDLWFQSVNKRAKILFAIIIICIPMVGGFFGSNVPTFFMHDSSPNPHYYYSNNLSSVGTFGATGEWIKKFTPLDLQYITEQDTTVAVFFYGQRPIDNIYRDYEEHQYPFLHNATKGYYIVANPNTPYSNRGEHLDMKSYFNSTDNLYSNGQVIVARD